MSVAPILEDKLLNEICLFVNDILTLLDEPNRALFEWGDCLVTLGVAGKGSNLDTA